MRSAVAFCWYFLRILMPCRRRRRRAQAARARRAPHFPGIFWSFSSADQRIIICLKPFWSLSHQFRNCHKTWKVKTEHFVSFVYFAPPLQLLLVVFFRGPNFKILTELRVWCFSTFRVDFLPVVSLTNSFNELIRVTLSSTRRTNGQRCRCRIYIYSP